jgi:uncharacterized protein YjbI with pentapeptide repeats
MERLTHFPSSTVKQAFVQFLEGSSFARRTRESYTEDLRPLLSQVGQAPITALTDDVVRSFLATQEALAPATYTRRLAALRSFSGFLFNRGWLTKTLKADLSEADLSRTDLSRADLSRTDLIGANLSRAKLSRADLSGAVLGEAVLAHIDLCTTTGLQTIDHAGPSYIELFSVQLPPDGSALHFLHGAGVPDEWIAFWRATMMHPIQYHSCFLSYSSHDTRLAERLHADLQARGVRCWFAPEDLKICRLYVSLTLPRFW